MKILETRRSLKFKLGLLVRQRWWHGTHTDKSQARERGGLARRCSESEILSLPTDTWRFRGTPIEFLMIAALSGFELCLWASGQLQSDDWAPMLTKRTHISILMGMGRNRKHQNVNLFISVHELLWEGKQCLYDWLWSWALLERPGVKPLDTFPALYATRRFITAFTRALHSPLS
jgi:hypothetical protein